MPIVNVRAIRRKVGWLLITAALVAGCSQVAVTPEPRWSQADADACNTAAIAFLSWDDEAPKAYALYYQDRGDLTNARKDAAGASKNYLKMATPYRTPGAETELSAVRSALKAGSSSFAASMTKPQFETAYQAIKDAITDFSNQCSVISDWVDEHVQS